MPSPKSTCPICYNEYNQTTHTPRIIPSCGHSLCSKCLAGLISHSLVFHCPIDRTTYNLVSRNVSSFPINYALQDLINEDANYEVCQHHEERMRLVCITDKCKVCDDCVLYGSHRGHEIKPLKKVQAETNKRIESLEGKLGEIKTWQKKFTDNLDDREKSFLEAVKKRFESLRAILKEKEEEVHKEVQAFFAKEKKEVNSYLGEGSSIQKTLKHEITSLKESKDKNLVKVLQDGLPQNSLNFNAGFFQQRLQDLTQRLQEIEASIDQPLMTQVLLLKNFEVKIADKLDSSRGPQRSASDAFLKPSPMSIRPLNMPKALNMDKNDSFDILVPIVSSARNTHINMNNNNNENREGKGMNMKYKILRDTFLQNSPRNSARTRPRIVQRDVKNYEMVNKTTFQW